MDINSLHINKTKLPYITESFLGKFSSRLVLFYIHKNIETKEITYEMLQSDLIKFNDQDWEKLDTFMRQYMSKKEQEGYTFASASVPVLRNCLELTTQNA